MKIEHLSGMVFPGGLFRTGQILAGQHSPADVRRQLDRWVRSGRILRLRRGVYMLKRPYAAPAAHPFAVANILKKASYVSLQSALGHYGMIPEFVPVTTSVTTGRPEGLETPLGRYEFRHVASHLFSGFNDVEVSQGQHALLATAQKALVDLLYLTPRSDKTEYLRELRLEKPESLDPEDLYICAHDSGSAKVMRAVDRLIALWDMDAKDEADIT